MIELNDMSHLFSELVQKNLYRFGMQGLDLSAGRQMACSELVTVSPCHAGPPSATKTHPCPGSKSTGHGAVFQLCDGGICKSFGLRTVVHCLEWTKTIRWCELAN